MKIKEIASIPHLVSGIITQAVRDYRLRENVIPKIEKKVKELERQIEEGDTLTTEKLEAKLAIKRNELKEKKKICKDAEAFFRSDRFDEMTEALDIDADKVREKLGITGKIPEKIL
jgi:hypothetical protein